MIGVGIDTGGTYTDAVIYDIEQAQVLAKCKRLTTKEDLATGIGNALDSLPVELLHKAKRLALSTTLATNACVEGKGGRAKLIIIGSTNEILHRIDAPKRYGMPYRDTLAIDSDSSYSGAVVDIPDWDRLYQRNKAFFEDADAFAIVDVYGINNGAAVERDGAAWLEEHFGKPVVQANSVAASLNGMERGATALLNARLLPVIDQFMKAVDRALESRGLDLPVMIVRSDGSLMSKELARIRPVATVLSGPAASVSGARSLTSEPESLIADMGGTTTDISIVSKDSPVMTDGIRIGGWATQISGVLIDTIGLGGDSEVCFSETGGLMLSPRRVQPLCIAASRWPQILEYLEDLVLFKHSSRMPLHELLYLVYEPDDLTHYRSDERALIEMLADGPVGLADKRIDPYSLDSRRLEDEGVVMRCGMTPTDAMHIKGDFDTYDTRASRLAVRCILPSIPHDYHKKTGQQIDAVADQIYALVEKKLFEQVSRVLIENRYKSIGKEGMGKQVLAVIEDAWKRSVKGTPAGPFDLDITTTAKLVGIGAPTHIFMPAVARALHTEYLIPESAEVANAIGAVHAEIVVAESARVVPNRGPDGIIESYQVHSSEMNECFLEADDAKKAAMAEAERCAIAEARRRGAIGELFCEVSDDANLATGSDGIVVILKWQYTAHVHTMAG